MRKSRGETLKAIPRWIDLYVGQLSGTLCAWLILPLIGVVCYEVFSRYVLKAPTVWAYDISYMLYGTHFMLGATYTLYRGMHVRTDILYDRFSVRKKGIINSVMYLLFFFPGMFFFMIVGMRAASDSWALKETSMLSPWGAPLYLYKTVLPISAALLLIQGISEFIKSAYAGWNGEEP